MALPMEQNLTDARRPYPSDLSDAEWVLLEPLLRRREKRGRPPTWPVRCVADAVFYLLRSGCAWRMLPREFPPWPTVYYHFRKWHHEGTLARAHDLLRGEVRAREGRKRDASAAIVASQSAKTTGVGDPERGYDGAKRLKGRKRHILVDTSGLLLSATVHGADLQDREGGRRLMSADLRRKMPRLELVWADAAYAGRFGEWAREERGWRVEVVHRPDRQTRRYGLEEEKPRGFKVVPRRWVVERTLAWLGQARRLAKDYERLPGTAVAMIQWAMSRIMLRRLASAAR